MRKFIAISVIVIVLMPVIILSALAVGALASEYGFFENYSKWKEVEIPTETELRATVKIPKKWDLVVENGRIKIKDEGGNVIATECYADWVDYYYENGIWYGKFEEVDVNEEIPEPYRNFNGYELEHGSSTGCYLYKITVDSKTSYALEMHIMDRYDVEGDFYLFLLFDSEIDDKKLYKKIQKSYSFGGYITDEDE